MFSCITVPDLKHDKEKIKVKHASSKFPVVLYYHIQIGVFLRWLIFICNDQFWFISDRHKRDSFHCLCPGSAFSQPNNITDGQAIQIMPLWVSMNTRFPVELCLLLTLICKNTFLAFYYVHCHARDKNNCYLHRNYANI